MIRLTTILRVYERHRVFYSARHSDNELGGTPKICHLRYDYKIAGLNAKSRLQPIRSPVGHYKGQCPN